MPRNFKTQLAGQIGESLVVAELGRRGVVASAFAGNVPDIDILAYRDGFTTALQVKSIRTGSVSFDASRYLLIDFEGDKQIVKGCDPSIDHSLIYVFVSIGLQAGNDSIFILHKGQLQKIIYENHVGWLIKHGGVRPKNPKSMHVSVSISDLQDFKDNWAVIDSRLSANSPHG